MIHTLTTLLLVVALAGCDAGRPLSNATIIAAKVECEAGGMKVQVHVVNNHAKTAICVPLSVYDAPAPVSVHGSTPDVSYSAGKRHHASIESNAHNVQADN